VSTFPLVEEGLMMYVRKPCRSWKLPRGVPSWRSDFVSFDTKSGCGYVRPVIQHDFTVVCSLVVSILLQVCYSQ